MSFLPFAKVLVKPWDTEAVTRSSAVPRRGYFYVILAALFWAVSGTSAKFLFERGVTPIDLVQIRLMLAAVLLLSWLAIKRSRLLQIHRRDVLYFAILGIAGMAMVQFGYFFAISKIKVAAAILLQYMAPAFIVLYYLVFARERVTLLVLLAMSGAGIGCYLVVGAYSLDLLALNRAGVISGLLSALAFAFYSIYGERTMRRHNPWTVFFYALAFAALFWNSAHFFWPSAPTPLAALRKAHAPIEWMWILYIVIFGTIIPFGLYFEGINLIRSTRASITATLEPIAAGVISFLFLGEALDKLQMLGGFLVILSVVMLQLRQDYDDKTPALLRLKSGSFTGLDPRTKDYSEEASMD